MAETDPSPVPAVPPGATLQCDLVYASPGGLALRLDLYRPVDMDKPVPVVVWLFGGGWRTGDKSHCKEARGLIEHGLAVASIQYRLSHQAIFPAQIEDARSAVRWLRAHADEYGLEASRIGAWGASAGGHLAALLGTAGHVEQWDRGEHLDQSSRVQAVCDWFGPTDLLRMNDRPGAVDNDAPDSPASELIGAPIREQPQAAARANPITYVLPDVPPFLIMHGTDDELVIPEQSRLLHRALLKAGGHSMLMLLEGLGHAFDVSRHPELIDIVGRFFERHLGKAKPPR